MVEDAGLQTASLRNGISNMQYTETSTIAVHSSKSLVLFPLSYFDVPDEFESAPVPVETETFVNHFGTQSLKVESVPNRTPGKSRIAAKFSFGNREREPSPSLTEHNTGFESYLAHEQELALTQESTAKKKKKKKKKSKGSQLPVPELAEIQVANLATSATTPTTDKPSTDKLEPVGVFWDIENCQVPRGKSALAIVETIRQQFLRQKREAEFLLVCDIHKENQRVIDELNSAQVTVVHVSCTSKNAADDKLRQCLWRFADTFGNSSTIICITSDVNFATDLSDMKNRRKMHVILLHSKHAPEALLLCANETHNFHKLIEHLPVVHQTPPKRCVSKDTVLEIVNLPLLKSPFRVRQRLHQLMENCGGKVISLTGARALARFPTPEAMLRAKIRMDGEDVFGNKLSVSIPQRGSALTEASSTQTKAPTAFPPPPQFSFPPPPDLRSVPPPQLVDMNGAPPVDERIEDTFTKAAREADGPGKYNYYRTPSEYLVEKTPQGYRRLRGAPKVQGSVGMYWNQDGERDRAAYIPYPLASAPECPREGLHSCAPVDLHVTNLDQSLSTKDMKHLLCSVFKQHVVVLHVAVHTQGDGRLAAVVRVPCMQDAQYAVSQLHRRKLGNKRIMISYESSNPSSGRTTPNVQQLRSQVNALLAEIPQRRLPLFKFRELFEQRFHSSVSLADLHRLRDMLQVTDDASGRSVVFLHRSLDTPSSDSSPKETEGGISSCEASRCPLHDPGRLGASIGWAEPEPMADLPLVFSGIRQLEVDLHRLLQSHNGSLPLASLPLCYEAEIGGLAVSEEKGVPLEHLISCIKGIRIVTVSGHKRIQWIGKLDSEQAQEPLQDLNPSLMPQISLFCRELVDLLKMAPQCRISFSKFIPAYHHHFGRQCRVADYGYTRLIDLLEALPHVVQVLGEGNRRHVTLSHRAQLRRFTSDLLRILKTLSSKQVAVSQFTSAYGKTLGRPFDARDYGVCLLEDLLDQVAEASVVAVLTEAGETMIALPRREQTPEEMERTKQFAFEAVELLRHAPLCRLPFAKFIPAYHHHFGRQCRVADYGFTKLIELFEAIADILTVFDSEYDGEKYVQLTTKQRLKILSQQVSNLVRSQASQRMALSELPDLFRRHYGFVLKPEAYDAVDHEDLVSKLRNAVKINYTDRGAELVLVDPVMLETMKRNIFKILYSTPEGQMAVHKLLQVYRQEYDQFECPLTILSEHMDEYLTVDNENYVEPVAKLVPVQLVARQVHVLLLENDRRVYLADFESAFAERFSTACQPALYGFANIISLLQAISHVVLLRGKGTRRILILNKETAYLNPPALPRSRTKPDEIRPPAHWLLPSAASEETQGDLGSGSSIKSVLVGANSASSMTLTSIPGLYSMPWGTLWNTGMAVGVALGVSPLSTSSQQLPAWALSTLPDYRYSYWLTPVAWPCGIASYESFLGTSASRASVHEIEETPKDPVPPPAAALPLPVLLTPPAMLAEEDEGKTVPRRRLAAQFPTRFSS